MGNEFSNIKERVIKLIDYKEVKKEVFFNRIGMTSANFRGKAKVTPLNSNAIVNILTTFPDLNPEWLLTGKGLMLRPVEAHREAPKALGNPQAVYELHEVKLATCVACDEKERVIQGFESQLQEVRHRLVDKDKQIESLERQIEGLKAGFENQIEDLKNNLGMVISEKSEVVKMKDEMLAMKDKMLETQAGKIVELEDFKKMQEDQTSKQKRA